MKVAQLLCEGASFFERRMIEIDRAAASSRWTVVRLEQSGDGLTVDGTALRPRELGKWLAGAGIDLVHVYATGRVPFALASELGGRWVSTASAVSGSPPWRKRPRPLAAISANPESPSHVPEAVDERWRDQIPRFPSSETPRILGTFTGERAGVRGMCMDTMNRLARFRDDVDWLLFDEPPSPEEVDQTHLWVDPAVAEDDLDGMVSEAMCRDRLVVASRIPVNRWRLENGASGFLVPAGDPNELAHSIATALFVEEAGEDRRAQARASLDRFGPAFRVRALEALYERLIR